MDANLQRPFQLADDKHWLKLGMPPRVRYDRARRALRLTSGLSNPNWSEDAVAAKSFLDCTPGSVDAEGTSATWDKDEGCILATGAFPDSVSIYAANPDSPVDDVAIGYDDVLYIAAGGHVVLKDLRNRWEPVPITSEFTAWRLAPTPEGGTYCLDRVNHRIGQIHGMPTRSRAQADYAPGTFRPLNENRNPPRARTIELATWPFDGEREVAIACSAEGRLALLTWPLDGTHARLRLLGADERFGSPIELRGVHCPYSLAWLGTDRVAVLIARNDGSKTQEAPVYPVSSSDTVVDPVGDMFPLREHRRGTPFLHGLRHIPEYLTEKRVRALHPISCPTFVESGMATNARAIDSVEPHTIWHRLYLEAAFPPGCGARVWLLTTDELQAPAADACWHEHRFGAVPAEASVDVPRGVWLRAASEIPFCPSLLPGECIRGQAGLWSALIQRPRYRVRTLTGRFLWVRLELFGDGRSTPEVAALRAYGGRRSYVKNYIPELYHESVFGTDAELHGETDDQRVASTGADFLERFVATFESVLTPLEDRIAASWLLTDPKSVPSEAIEWLASWISFSFAPGLPEERCRAMLEKAMELYRRRGTLRGLELALDLATGGSVRRRQILVFEDFRLRRTFATILGANYAAEEDPLLPGLLVSGNSFIGDTLFLGDEQNKEFLALFSEDLAVSSREQASIANLFERLAHRATVLVHEDCDEWELSLVRQIVDREAPAHVSVQVLTATQRFMVGMSSLVGIDTFLGQKPTPESVRVGMSTVGLRDRVCHVPSLDPRVSGVPS